MAGYDLIPENATVRDDSVDDVITKQNSPDPGLTGEESTYDSSSAQSAQSAQSYYSIRLTLAHNMWSIIYGYLCKDRSYVAYPHTGTATEKEHWHVLVLGDRSETDFFRNTVTRKLKLKGNEQYSIKFEKNGIESGITYCTHDKTSVPKFSEDLRTIIDGAPLWKEKRQSRIDWVPDAEYQKKIRDWQLTWTNLVSQCVAYRTKANLSTDNLFDVIRHMEAHSKWRRSIAIVKHGGIPTYYVEDFEFRVGLRPKGISWGLCVRDF